MTHIYNKTYVLSEGCESSGDMSILIVTILKHGIFNLKSCDSLIKLVNRFFFFVFIFRVFCRNRSGFQQYTYRHKSKILMELASYNHPVVVVFFNCPLKLVLGEKVTCSHFNFWFVAFTILVSITGIYMYTYSLFITIKKS